MECQKAQAYPCFLLDEAAICEEDSNDNYNSRISKAKEYKDKARVKDFEEGMKVDVRDTEGIWCPGVVKTILTNENTKMVLVHFEKWDNSFDEMIPADSPRIVSEGFYTSRNILKYKLPLPDGNNKAEVIKQ